MEYSNRLKKLRLNVLLMTVSMLPVLAQAGVVVGGTRFIYSGGQQNGISLTVQNTDPSPYLVQAKITPDNNADIAGSTPLPADVGAPFVLTPPLFRLGPQRANSLRVLRTGGNLPADRESLFRLSIAAIPGGQPGPNSLQIAIRSTFKLFYRPEHLQGNASQAYQQLSWQRQGTNVNVTNPTPFYVTLFQLKVNGERRGEAGMVPPFSTRSQPWCPASGKCQIEWQSLNDFGGVMSAWRVSPTATFAAGRASGS